MLQNLTFLITGFVLLLLQAHPFLPFGKGGIRPDLLLIFVIYIGIYNNNNKGALFCFLFGCFLEVLSSEQTGLYQTIYLSVFIIINILKKYFIFNSIIKYIILLLVCFFVKFIIIVFLFYYIFEQKNLIFNQPFFKENLFSFILFPFVFICIRKLFHYKNIDPGI